MRESDQQLGKPMRAYRDTKANIVGLGLGAADEGCIAYANDVDDFGTFDGANWTWIAAPPAVAGYALVSGGIDTWVADQTPAWTGEHSFAAGIAFTGASGANEITVPDNTAIALELLDAGGLEYMRVVSTDANPYLLIDPAATGFLVGVGIAAPAAHLDVYDATVNTTATYHGGRFDHTKTAGVTDTADNLCGLMGNMRFNQVGGVVGHVDGLSGQAAIAVGEIGQSGTLRHLRGLICNATHTGGTTWGDVMGAYMFVDANAGTIGRDVFGCNITVDIEAAMTSIGQNVYGLRVWMDVDQDPVGTVYGIYLTEGSNQDYGFYQSGSADNYFGGSVGIGLTTLAYKLDVADDVDNYIARFWNDGNNDNRRGILVYCGLDTNPAARLISLRDGNGTTIGHIVGDGAGGVTYWSASDERLKNILGPIDPDRAMGALIEIDPIRYVGKGLTAKTGRENVGFSAQEILKHFPEVGSHDEEQDEYGLSYERLVPILWAQNKVLLSRIEQLEN